MKMESKPKNGDFSFQITNTGEAYIKSLKNPTETLLN